MFKNLGQSGQATIEYLFLIIFVATLGIAIVNNLREFIGNQTGNLAYVLSVNLATGICPNNCFYDTYLNGF